MAYARSVHNGSAHRRGLPRLPVVGLLTIGALIVMGAFAGVAQAAAVTGLTVDPLTPSAAGGARTDYVLHFTTSATGALTAGQHITITLPSGASVRTDVNSSVTVAGNATSMGSCGVGSSDNIAVCTLGSNRSIAAGAAVTVELDGVTNPAANPTGAQQTLSVVTDTDTTSAAANYTVVAPQSASSPTVTDSPPTTAAGGRTVYTISFTTSSTGGMSGKANSQITITLPSTTNVRTDVNSSVTVGGGAPSAAAASAAPTTSPSASSGPPARSPPTPR